MKLPVGGDRVRVKGVLPVSLQPMRTLTVRGGNHPLSLKELPGPAFSFVPKRVPG